jgi:hypothetical protein
VKDEPLALMCNLVPESVTDLRRVDLEKTGLYEHFRAQAINLRVAHQVIGARTVDAQRHGSWADARATPC